jgi:D-3-phosphoglycerate dehydrogenase / 2-oxoglutarate reductase
VSGVTWQMAAPAGHSPERLARVGNDAGVGRAIGGTSGEATSKRGAMTLGKDEAGGARGAAAGQRPLVAVVDSAGNAFGPSVLSLLEDGGCRVVTSTASSEEEIVEVVRDADGIIYTGPISRSLFASLMRCKVLARTSIGMDIVEGVDLATEKGIVLCNMPGIIEEEVADQTMALFLAVVRGVLPLDGYVRTGAWSRREQPPDVDMPRLLGSTLGLVGFGGIGRAVARRALGFGLRLLAFDPFVPAERIAAGGAQPGTLGQVLQDSDVVSLHVPLTKATHHLIGERELLMMRRDAILVNTSRGPVVDERALTAALVAGAIAGAGLDVFEEEPIPPDSPLLGLPNVVLAPHSASQSRWANHERHLRPAQEVLAVLAGLRPRAVWNPEVLDRLDLR